MDEDPPLPSLPLPKVPFSGMRLCRKVALRKASSAMAMAMATSPATVLPLAPPGRAAPKPHHRHSPRSVQLCSSFSNAPLTAAKRTRSRSVPMATGTGSADGLGSGSAPSSAAAEGQREAAEMVREFYGAINRREVASIGDLFAEDCVYEDLVFPKPFRGRKAVLEFFQKFMDSVGSELEFKVDDITAGDPNAAGVTWHLEWNGKAFPFSKGCSFYRCQVLHGKRQIVYGRDAVEPATKPGDLTLVALKGVAAILRRFPSLAEKF